jgi:small subunit ribosomal protein S1
MDTTVVTESAAPSGVSSFEAPVETAVEPTVQAEQAEPADAPAPVEATAPVEQPTAQTEGRKKAEETWKRLAGAKESRESLSGRVKSEIKGGLLLDIEGYRAFLPASQARVAKGEALGTLVNTDVPVKVLEVDEKRKRLVVSHRRALEDERRNARKALLDSLRVGEEREATVVRLADFGAFVDLGGVDALVPVGELAFERVERPSDVVNVGDTFTVRVLRVEAGGKKIAASRKAALADPWRDHADVFERGRTIEGTVVAKEPRLIVEIAPGVTGSLSDRDANPDEYEIGEKVEVTVRSVDYRQRRIRLGVPHSAAAFSPSGFAPLGAELAKSFKFGE